MNGSVLENEQAGAGFVIPEFKTVKPFYLGNGRSIFISYNYIVVLPMALFNILIFVWTQRQCYTH